MAQIIRYNFLQKFGGKLYIYINNNSFVIINNRFSYILQEEEPCTMADAVKTQPINAVNESRRLPQYIAALAGRYNLLIERW